VLLCIARRSTGPDSHVLHRQTTRSGHVLRFFGAVLHLRGPTTVAQPVVSSSPGATDVLLWNGQVFEGLSEVEAAGSDTVALWQRFERAKLQHGGDDAVRSVLASIEGP
jgi:hypothetical protein